MIILEIVLWIGLSFLVALTGNEKKIGYWGVFFLSLLLSPLIGLIIGLVSSSIDKVEELRSEAIEFKNNKDYNSAIDSLRQALSFAPTNPKILYDMACYYSLKNDTDNSLKTLGRAVELGYSNFASINDDADLKNLRGISEFNVFKKNNYKLLTNQNIPIESNLDKIKKLKDLLDTKTITEDEFTKQKKNILENIDNYQNSNQTFNILENKSENFDNELRIIKELFDKGILSSEEFNIKKGEIEKLEFNIQIENKAIDETRPFVNQLVELKNKGLLNENEFTIKQNEIIEKQKKIIEEELLSKPKLNDIDAEILSTLNSVKIANIERFLGFMKRTEVIVIYDNAARLIDGERWSQIKNSDSSHLYKFIYERK